MIRYRKAIIRNYASEYYGNPHDSSDCGESSVLLDGNLYYHFSEIAFLTGYKSEELLIHPLFNNQYDFIKCRYLKFKDKKISSPTHQDWYKNCVSQEGWPIVFSELLKHIYICDSQFNNFLNKFTEEKYKEAFVKYYNYRQLCRTGKVETGTKIHELYQKFIT